MGFVSVPSYSPLKMREILTKLFNLENEKLIAYKWGAGKDIYIYTCTAKIFALTVL